MTERSLNPDKDKLSMALAVMELGVAATPEQVVHKYVELQKRRDQGQISEEQFKFIDQAFAVFEIHFNKHDKRLSEMLQSNPEYTYRKNNRILDESQDSKGTKLDRTS
jgi:hypothetical protein